MKTNLLILIFISITRLGYGQSDSTQFESKILIKWTPTALLGYSALQFAAEFSYKPKKSFQIEYGLIIPTLTAMRNKNKGHRIRIEQRNYLNKGENLYLAPEVHLTYVQYKAPHTFSQNWEEDSLSETRYALDRYTDEIGVQKIAMSGNFKFGFQYIFKNPKLLFDVYCGLGIRYVITKFTSYPSVGERVPPIDNFFDDYDHVGNRFFPSMIVGLKVGYQIK